MTKKIYGVGIVGEGKYSAGAGKKNKHFHLGNFETIDEAFNTYKEAKERNIKERAEKYKNVINNRAYNALIDYKIEITD